ncbi:hypothetical protein C0J52_17277 [Blattella germanica]|nr:hypothetical protein C0J52_17277 [Blattella germanica]
MDEFYEDLHNNSNDNGVRLVTFATSKNLIHKDLIKYTWMSSDGETRNQIDHILVDKRWHSSINHHLVRVKIRERLALTRGTDTKVDSEKFEFKNLRNDEINDLEMNAENRNIRELYQGIKVERRNYFNQLLNNNVQTAEVLVEEPSALEVEMGTELLIWKQEALPNEWKESIIIPIYKKGDKMDCNYYRDISLLSTSYKILTNILVSRLTPYIDIIIGDHQCAFRANRSTIDQIFSIRQILEKKWEYNGTVHQLYVDFKKAYYSIRREKLLIVMCLNGTKNRVQVGKQVSDIFEIHNRLKQGDVVSPLLIHKLLVHADNKIANIVLLGDSEETLKDNMHILRSNTRRLGWKNTSCNANGHG